MRKIQFGIPITMIKGGIKAVNTVISYSSKPIIPKVHITPISTTTIEINVALQDLKKKKNINEVTPSAAMINFPISSMMFWEFKVRIYGIPETRTFSLVLVSKASTLGIKTSVIKSFRAGVFTIFLSKYMADLTALLFLLNKKLS